MDYFIFISYHPENAAIGFYDTSDQRCCYKKIHYPKKCSPYDSAHSLKIIVFYHKNMLLHGAFHRKLLFYN